MRGKLKALLLVVRAPFLILTFSCISVGFASAIYHGYFNSSHAILALIGSLLAHISVNVLNEYYDYKRGTDLLTHKTPFSGGSGALPSGLIDQNQAFKIGVVSLISGGIIGLYFITLYPILLPLIIIASAIIFLYTPILLKNRFAEFFPGLSFGPLLVIGAYITQLPKNYMGSFIIPAFASIPVGLLVSNLLILNEFPDYEADLSTGRRHGVITLGRERTSRLYVLIMSLTYASIIVPAVLSILPLTTLITLSTLPLAVKTSKNVLRNYDNPVKLIPSLAQNTYIVLLSPILIALGLII
ncbi:MAG: prenyltransferase [Candidatus Bathyarchaeota archaeon]|nr:prenyltransferase [Candidatus Bathyarchaeota archaeon]